MEVKGTSELDFSCALLTSQQGQLLLTVSSLMVNMDAPTASIQVSLGHHHICRETGHTLQLHVALPEPTRG